MFTASVPPAHNLGHVIVASEVAVTKFDNDAFRGDAIREKAKASIAGCKTLGKVDRETLAAYLLKSTMPSFASLSDLATMHSPPAEYFDGEMERPW